MVSSTLPPRSFPALFVRGGTTTGLVIMRDALPQDQEQWNTVLPSAMGSPDPVHARQLNGMGGGTSSTSKICVLSRSERPDVDVDFTFVQVGIKDGVLDLASNCGNMSSAVGPVAWDEGLVGDTPAKVKQDLTGQDRDPDQEDYREATVRFFNTNTSKVVHSRFRVSGDPPRYCPEGDYAMDGVPGTQSCITLSFLDPAGAKTGKALPTGNAVDILELPGGAGSIPASLVDVSNPGVFVRVSDLEVGQDVTAQKFTPAVVDADAKLKARLEAIRQAGATRMGLDPKTESVPKIVLLFDETADDGVDVQCLALSMGQPHKDVPLTLALCLGAAANIPGTLAAEVRRRRDDDKGSSSSVVIGHPSGRVEISTTVENGKIVSADLLRTARVLMKGEVYY
ncbi:PrpF protein [Microdochium trichocladiopsis]|uniref:PrpF protein n=1 Tax=Microdochium trichocladiopsis TaxID=1682393 RepID=A0A9P8YJM9_9PEZI|nr:PrpF protein [Microdochium trichocladiopsis]KAH7041103.1 PrpF protein [Microdochium trichocladiopsis]